MNLNTQILRTVDDMTDEEKEEAERIGKQACQECTTECYIQQDGNHNLCSDVIATKKYLESIEIKEKRIMDG